jgi:hypothetical protein
VRIAEPALALGGRRRARSVVPADELPGQVRAAAREEARRARRRRLLREPAVEPGKFTAGGAVCSGAPHHQFFHWRSSVRNVARGGLNDGAARGYCEPARARVRAAARPQRLAAVAAIRAVHPELQPA